MSRQGGSANIQPGRLSKSLRRVAALLKFSAADPFRTISHIPKFIPLIVRLDGLAASPTPLMRHYARRL